MLCSEMATLHPIHMFSRNQIHDVFRQNRDDVTVENVIDSKVGHDM